MVYYSRTYRLVPYILPPQVTDGNEIFLLLLALVLGRTEQELYFVQLELARNFPPDLLQTSGPLDRSFLLDAAHRFDKLFSSLVERRQVVFQVQISEADYSLRSCKQARR